MIRYWTFWNFMWYSLCELKYIGLSYPLKISIINTSILGLIITNSYLHSILQKKNKKIKKIE